MLDTPTQPSPSGRGLKHGAGVTRRTVAFAVTFVALLAGCATIPRLYPPEQIAAVTRSCGLAIGELFQEAEEPKILFLIAPDVSRGQRACVHRWARKRNLHLAYVEAIVQSTE